MEKLQLPEAKKQFRLGSGTHGKQIGQMRLRFEKILQNKSKNEDFYSAANNINRLYGYMQEYRLPTAKRIALMLNQSALAIALKFLVVAMVIIVFTSKT